MAKKEAVKRKTKSRKKPEGTLVVVESPTKARTLERFLGARYRVVASQGHVMDLPASRFGVDLEKGFEPEYIVIQKKRRIVKELKNIASNFAELVLATDPDREGEAISAHLAALLADGKPVRRAVFHEITPQAIEAAFRKPVEIDRHKVQAQQARRVLDRVLGYSLSPLLWKKVGRGLSAGRVQSVVLKLIVDRERAIRAFQPQEYWQIEALLEKRTQARERFTAWLETIDGKKADLKKEPDARGLVEELENSQFAVSKITRRQQRRNPSAPFTTSSLQQDAFNRLGFTAARTMRIAQQLYEGIDLGDRGPVGLITYMRTDSVQVAREAVSQARAYIAKVFGKEYLPETPPRYRSRKRAQEAHEAIRPTAVERTPEALKAFLTPEQIKLYALIWNRFVASQMAPARVEVTRLDIRAGRCGLRASGTRILFPGHHKVLRPEEAQDRAKKKEQTEEPDQSRSQILPELTEGEKLEPISVTPSQHFTKPPARFTEASLVRAMEELGIGRPSTYAPTLQTIVNRGYCVRQGRSLIPEELGQIVTDLLAEHFPKVLEVRYTAQMEEELDGVEAGDKPWEACVRHFYEPFAEALKTAHSEMKSVKQAPEPIDEKCPKCGRGLVIKWGRNGKFISCSGFPECRFSRSITTGVPCPEAGCDGELVARRSRRGRFYGCSRFPACRRIERQLPARSESSAEAAGGAA